MYGNFNLVKNHKIANNLATTKAREKHTYLEQILEIFYVFLTEFKSNQILLNKISHRFQATTKLFSEWKSLIASLLNAKLGLLGRRLSPSSQK